MFTTWTNIIFLQVRSKASIILKKLLQNCKSFSNKGKTEHAILSISSYGQTMALFAHFWVISATDRDLHLWGSLFTHSKGISQDFIDARNAIDAFKERTCKYFMNHLHATTKDESSHQIHKSKMLFYFKNRAATLISFQLIQNSQFLPKSLHANASLPWWFG